jgi:hypothetical protein
MYQGLRSCDVSPLFVFFIEKPAFWVVQRAAGTVVAAANRNPTRTIRSYNIHLFFTYRTALITKQKGEKSKKK